MDEKGEMDTMKKLLALALSLAMTLSLAACGSSGSTSSEPDVTALKTSYSTLADSYNDMIAVATENGWDKNAEIVEGLNKIAAEVEKVKGVIEKPADYTQEQIDEMAATCNELNDWTADMKDAVSVPYTEEASSDASAGNGNILDIVETTTIPADIAGTSWSFYGGYLDGVEMTDEEYTAALAQYGGTLDVLFVDDTTVNMVQGGGTLTGTYALSDEKTLRIEFPNEGLVYAGMYTESSGVPVLLLFSDDTGLNAIYFTYSTEG